MTYPIHVTVRYSTQAYHCRLQGVSASSTMNPETAAQRVADKLWGEGTHQVRMLKDCMCNAPGLYEITPVAKPAPALASSDGSIISDGTTLPAWRPHTERPDTHCAALIAVPVEGLDDSNTPSPMLMPRVFNWHPINGWVEEETDAPLVYPEFWWMPEDALLAPLMPAEI